MDEIKKRKIINAFVQGAVPLDSLSKSLYITERQLRLLLESWGVETRKKRNKVIRPQREVLLAEYAKFGTTDKLAKHHKISIGKINRWLKELKIPTRKMKMRPEEQLLFLEEHLEKLGNFTL